MITDEESFKVLQRGSCKCGISVFGNGDIERLNKLAIVEIFDEEQFECIKCPQNLLSMDFYRNIGITFGKLCQLYVNYAEDLLQLSKKSTLSFAFLVDVDMIQEGGCGLEGDQNTDHFKLYINPLICDPEEEGLSAFSKVLIIAQHEAVHVILHQINSAAYNILDNYHGEDFFRIYHILDQVFYDREHLKKTFWKNY